MQEGSEDTFELGRPGSDEPAFIGTIEPDDSDPSERQRSRDSNV
jgi:hypothetical protein